MPKLFQELLALIDGNPLLKGRNWYVELQEELTRDKQMDLT